LVAKLSENLYKQSSVNSTKQ